MSRAIYDKAIFHRDQQMDRKVYDRVRNVLPISGGGDDDHGSIEPSNHDWYILDSIELVDRGSGFEVGESFVSEFFDAGARSDITPQVEVTEVDENGAILSMEISTSGLVALSVNNNTLPLTVSISPSNESGTPATIACNWKPYIINTAIPEAQWEHTYTMTSVGLSEYDPAGGFDYVPDDPENGTLTFEIDNGVESLTNPRITFDVATGNLSNPVITEPGVLGINITDDTEYGYLEVIIPGNPGKGAMLWFEFDTDEE